MAQPTTAEILAVENATATAQKQLTALSAALALVSTNYTTAGSTTTVDLSGTIAANINALSNVLGYYQVLFANLNGNAIS